MTAQVDFDQRATRRLGVLGWAVNNILALAVDGATTLRTTGSLPPVILLILEVAADAQSPRR